MKKMKEVLNSPTKKIVFAICVILILAILAFGAVKAGASMLNKKGIGLEKATEIALQDAGYQESEVSLLKGHFDRDDGFNLYEIDFSADGYSFEYVINADDGAIIEVDRDGNGMISGGKQDSDAQQSGGNGDQASAVSLDEAKQIAIDDISAKYGVTATLGDVITAWTKKDDGIDVHEIDFRVGNMEYDYEIAVETGRILDCDADNILD